MQGAVLALADGDDVINHPRFDRDIQGLEEQRFGSSFPKLEPIGSGIEDDVARLAAEPDALERGRPACDGNINRIQI